RLIDNFFLPVLLRLPHFAVHANLQLSVLSQPGIMVTSPHQFDRALRSDQNTHAQDKTINGLAVCARNHRLKFSMMVNQLAKGPAYVEYDTDTENKALKAVLIFSAYYKQVFGKFFEEEEEEEEEEKCKSGDNTLQASGLEGWKLPVVAIGGLASKLRFSIDDAKRRHLQSNISKNLNIIL
ncbi:hypothetical protein C0J52_24350, partial [Blattella germanica]